MRTYEKTHHWLSFTFNLASAPPIFWIRLGEAASKIEHISKVPLLPETSQKLLQVYLAKGAAATTAIEGNTLSEDEVLEVVRGKLQVPSSREYLKQEVQNVLGVFNEIAAQILENNLPPISPALIKEFNAKVLNNLPLDEGVIPGIHRMHRVGVGTYLGAPAEDCDFLMDRYCEWLNGNDFSPKRGYEVVNAIIKAIVAHIYLAWIHPFGDGNGRTARLIELHILMAAGVPSPAGHLISNHYNQTRAEYYRQLDRASKSGGEILPFIEYAVHGLVDGLRSQLAFVWDQNWHVAWQNFVHRKFQAGSGEANRRRRILALELGTKGDWVTNSAISELSPALGRLYAKKGPKTIQRDINEIASLKIVQKGWKRVRAKRELIFQFLPVQKMAQDNNLSPNATETPSGQKLLSLRSPHALS